MDQNGTLSQAQGHAQVQNPTVSTTVPNGGNRTLSQQLQQQQQQIMHQQQLMQQQQPNQSEAQPADQIYNIGVAQNGNMNSEETNTTSTEAEPAPGTEARASGEFAPAPAIEAMSEKPQDKKQLDRPELVQETNTRGVTSETGDSTVEAVKKEQNGNDNAVIA